MKATRNIHMVDLCGLVGLNMTERVCLDCGSGMLEITTDGKQTEGYLCFVCGKEVKL